MPTTEPVRVLYVGPDDEVGRAVVEALREGYDLQTARSSSEAISQVEDRSPRIALVTEHVEGNQDGVEFLRRLAEEHPPVTRILLAGQDRIEAALHFGCAHRFLFTPLAPAQIASVVSDALRTMPIEDELEEHKERVIELEALALRDGLTGLFNHRYFHESLEREISRAKRHSVAVSIVLIDVDEFKTVNDRYGHPVGDAVVKTLGDLLRGEDTAPGTPGFRLRAQDVAARYGGDEFALLLPETTKSGAALVAERLRKCVVDHDFSALGIPGITLSLGVATLPDDADNRAALVETADRALYVAKELGRNRMVAYSAHLQTSHDLERADAEELDLLLEKCEVRFAYQAIVDVPNRRVAAYEALVRPDGERLSNPFALISAAERFGKMKELGRVMRKSAVAPIDELPEGTLLFVNLHPYEVNDPTLFDPSELMEASKRVVFEISESLHASDYDKVRVVMERLREGGARIALDDLGAGQAGFGSLVHLEPDYIKLDISLVRGIHAGTRAARLLRHVIEFAKGEGIETIAEGVETEEEERALLEVGCHWMQGWRYQKAEPPFTPVLFP